MSDQHVHLLFAAVNEQRFRARLAALEAATRIAIVTPEEAQPTSTGLAEIFERWLMRPVVETLDTSKVNDGATDRPSCSTIWRKADGAGHMCALDEHGDRRHACSCGETLD